MEKRVNIKLNMLLIALLDLQYYNNKDARFIFEVVIILLLLSSTINHFELRQKYFRVVSEIKLYLSLRLSIGYSVIFRPLSTH